MPLQRRLPKRGFKNYLFKVEYEVINLARLVAAFEGKSEISLDDIYDRGLCPSRSGENPGRRGRFRRHQGGSAQVQPVRCGEDPRRWR